MKPDGVGSLYGPGLVGTGLSPSITSPSSARWRKTSCRPRATIPQSGALTKPGVGSDTDLSNVASCDPRFPIICSTYRISEHWQTGRIDALVPWLAEMQPGDVVSR